jgi:hypothetical protein
MIIMIPPRPISWHHHRRRPTSWHPFSPFRPISRHALRPISWHLFPLPVDNRPTFWHAFPQAVDNRPTFWHGRFPLRPISRRLLPPIGPRLARSPSPASPQPVPHLLPRGCQQPAAAPVRRQPARLDQPPQRLVRRIPPPARRRRHLRVRRPAAPPHRHQHCQRRPLQLPQHPIPGQSIHLQRHLTPLAQMFGQSIKPKRRLEGEQDVKTPQP